MTNPEVIGTVYLDIDGVILPYFERSSITYGQGLEAVWLNPSQYYYPEVVEELGKIAANIVLSTSNGISFFMNPEYNPIKDRLDIAGSIRTDPWNPAHIHNKFDNVMKHWTKNERLGQVWPGHINQALGQRAVWLDDHIPKLGEADAARLDSHTEMMAIAPEGNKGLDLADIERVRQFLVGNNILQPIS